MPDFVIDYGGFRRLELALKLAFKLESSQDAKDRRILRPRKLACEDLLAVLMRQLLHLRLHLHLHAYAAYQQFA